MAPQWQLLLGALLATRLSTIIGARLGTKSLAPNAKEETRVDLPLNQGVESYASAVQTPDLVMFDEPEVTNETTTQMTASQEGCEKAVKYKRGLMTASGEHVFTWECLRCREGYMEDVKTVSVPPALLEKYKYIKGRTSQIKRICKWRPGGSLCEAADAHSSTMKQKLMGGHDLSCLKCFPQEIGKSELVDVNIKAVDPEGKQVVIKKICSPVRAVAADVAQWSDSKVLMEKLLTKFDGFLPTGMFQMIQIADAFRMKVTQTFLGEGSTDAEKLEKDMVGDGSKFMQDKIQSAMEEFQQNRPPERLKRIARSFVESGKVQEIRGALDLCFLTAMNEMDGSENDSRFISAGKACRSTDYVFVVMLDVFCKQVFESPKCNEQYPDWESSQVAPRQAIEILRMFGAIQ